MLGNPLRHTADTSLNEFTGLDWELSDNFIETVSLLFWVCEDAAHHPLDEAVRREGGHIWSSVSALWGEVVLAIHVAVNGLEGSEILGRGASE